MMGLSKYVLPIDSRVAKKIEDLSSITLNKKLLVKNYVQVENMVNEICKSIDIYQCIFGACTFSGQERQ